MGGKAKRYRFVYFQDKCIERHTLVCYCSPRVFVACRSTALLFFTNALLVPFWSGARNFLYIQGCTGFRVSHCVFRADSSGHHMFVSLFAEIKPRKLKFNNTLIRLGIRWQTLPTNRSFRRNSRSKTPGQRNSRFKLNHYPRLG